MTCPGLHCPGCSEGQSLGVLAGTAVGVWVAYEALQVVREYIWWIGGTVAVCFALSVAVTVWLAGLTERREAAFAARHGILSRADVILPAPRATPQVTAGTWPAVEYHVHHHHYHADVPEPVRVIPGKVLP